MKEKTYTGRSNSGKGETYRLYLWFHVCITYKFTGSLCISLQLHFLAPGKQIPIVLSLLQRSFALLLEQVLAQWFSGLQRCPYRGNRFSWHSMYLSMFLGGQFIFPSVQPQEFSRLNVKQETGEQDTALPLGIILVAKKVTYPLLCPRGESYCFVYL